MKKNIYTLQKLLQLTFIILCLGLIYWQLLQANTLLARDDNPRLVIAEQKIKRGKIINKEGVIIAETSFDSNNLAQRHYHYPNLAAVTGYYSIRYGTDGLESTFDSKLRGTTKQTWLANLLHRPLIGNNITVTIQIAAQTAAYTALAQTNATGAVIVLNAQSGEILVMSSYPTFNPNTLNQDWDTLIDDPTAPLLNRVTQGIFPLGEMVQVVGLIALLENNIENSNTLLNAPLENVLTRLSKQQLLSLTHQLQFNQELPFNLSTSAGLIPQSLTDKTQEIAITPLHLALVGAALSQDGLAPTPTLVVQNNNPSLPQKTPFFKPSTAKKLLPLFTQLSALATPKVTGSDPLSWYLGITDGNTPLVIVVVITTIKNHPYTAQEIAQVTLQAVK